MLALTNFETNMGDNKVVDVEVGRDGNCYSTPVHDPVSSRVGTGFLK